MTPKPPPRAPKTSPSLDLHWFFIEFGQFFNDFLYHVGYFLSGLPHYFFGYLEVSFSNFWPQVQMCWGRPQGSARSQKSAMWPTFCLACLFVFVTSSPTSQVSGHRFFGIVSRVISELWSTARWRECRRQLRSIFARVLAQVMFEYFRQQDTISSLPPKGTDGTTGPRASTHS